MRPVKNPTPGGKDAGEEYASKLYTALPLKPQNGAMKGFFKKPDLKAAKVVIPDQV